MSKPETVTERTKREPAPGISIERIHLATPAESYTRHRAVILRADSLAALARFLSSPEGAARGAYQAETEGGSRKVKEGKKAEDWDLGAGWEGALDFAARGWKEGRQGLRAAAATLDGEFHPRPPQAFDVAGDWLDVPSAIAGDPEQWGYDEEAPGRARIIRLGIPLSASWTVPASTLRNRGAAIAAIIDGLESEGIRCEVDAYSVHEGGAEAQAVIIHRVKEAGAHLSLDRLAASIIHPGTFRRLHFAGLEHLGGESIAGFDVDDLRHGYGIPADFRDPFRRACDPSGTYHLPLTSTGDFATPEKARETIRAQMKELGFDFDPSPSLR